MAAYGLYSHIQSNKRRSIALLIGLFFLVYVMTYAGALLAEALLGDDAPLDVLLRRGAGATSSMRCPGRRSARCCGSSSPTSSTSR